MKGYALSRARDYYSGTFATMVFEGLTRLDSAGQVRPSLARGWEVADGGRTFRFRLRSGVRFHDGTAFSASDVVRAWTTALREPSGTEHHAWMLDMIDGAESLSRGGGLLTGARALDDTTLEVRLTQPQSLFPREIAEAVAFIGAATSDDLRPVGTGPWRWRSGPANGDRIVLERNDAYWGTPPRMDSLIVRVLMDSLLVPAFAAGEVDCTADLTRASLTALAAQTDIRLTRAGPPGLVRLVFNVRRPPLNDLRVRRALGLALDRQRLAREASAGPVVVANGPLPPGVLGADPERPGLAYDAQAARRLLAAAGFLHGRPLSIVLPDDETPEFSADFSSLLRSYWAVVGVRVVPWVEGDTTTPDIDLRISYPDGTDPDDYLYSRFHSRMAGMGGNLGGFGDPLVDRWLDSGRVIQDTAVRGRLMRDANARIDSLAPNIVLWYTPVTTASRTRINGCVAGTTTSTYVTTDLASGTPRP